MPARLRRAPRAPVPVPAPPSPSAARSGGSPRRRLPRRLRVLLATRPLAYWSLTAVVAVALGATVYGVAASAEQTRARLGVVEGRGRRHAGHRRRRGARRERHRGPRPARPASWPRARWPACLRAPWRPPPSPPASRSTGCGSGGEVTDRWPPSSRTARAASLCRSPLLACRSGRATAWTWLPRLPRAMAGRLARWPPGALVVHVDDKAVVVAVGAAETTAVAQALADGAVVLALSAGRVAYTMRSSTPSADPVDHERQEAVRAHELEGAPDGQPAGDAGGDDADDHRRPHAVGDAVLHELRHLEHDGAAGDRHGHQEREPRRRVAVELQPAAGGDRDAGARRARVQATGPERRRRSASPSPSSRRCCAWPAGCRPSTGAGRRRCSTRR